MSKSQIVYNSKTIDIGIAPAVLKVDPVIPKVINTTLSGVSDILYAPRVDLRVHVEIKERNSATLRAQLENWWQWAQRGGDWTFAIDSTKTVATTLASAAASGATSVIVTSATGITIGQQYFILDAAIYRVITVSGVSGTTISFSDSLDNAISSNARFHDFGYWNGIIPASDAPSPLVDFEASEGAYGQGFPLRHFNVVLDFYQKL